MKILFVETDPQYLLGLPYGFQKIGCQIRIANDITEGALIGIIEEFQPDLVMTAGWTKIHTKSKLMILSNLLKKYKLKHAYWATEDPRWTEHWSLPFIEATHPDYIFTIDQASLPFYQAKGYKADYLPWACNPEFHKPADPKGPYQCDIALVATAGVTWSSYRKDSAQILLKPLVEKNYNVAIWGKRWDKLEPKIVGFNVPAGFLRGQLSYLETNHVYSSAKIVLGFQNITTELTSRTFEVLGARCFLLAPATPAIQDTFVSEKHLAVSSSEADTLKMVDYYLTHDKERMQIANEGQKFVYDNHTYSHRAEKILEVIGKGTHLP